MWTRAACFVAVAAVALANRCISPPDVSLKAPISDVSVQQALRQMEDRQVELTARLEVLTHTVDTQLGQLDASMLQLFKELGSSRLRETLAQLQQAAAATEPPAMENLPASLSQQLQETQQQIQTQLNDTQDRLTTLLDKACMAPTSVTAPTTTIVVERCSYVDQFQTVDEWRPADCAAVQQRHQRSGVYTVYPTSCGNGGGIRVFCDMDTDGGGWTVLMRRADVSSHQDFNLGWQSYKWGFGNLTGEFWLGNEYMNLLTSIDQVELRIDLHDWANGSRIALYTPFSVGSEQQKYILKLGKYSGNAGNSLAIVNNGKFSTKDQDNDSWSKHCTVEYQNAWWHKACMYSTLTGPYKTATIKTAWIGVTWQHWKGNKYSLKNVEMKMRPINYMTWCHKMVQEGARD